MTNTDQVEMIVYLLGDVDTLEGARKVLRAIRQLVTHASAKQDGKLIRQR